MAGADITDYKVYLLIYGYAELPADWVYRGKHLAGEITHDPFGFAAVVGGGRTILVDCGANLADPAKREIFGCDIYHCLDTMSSPEAALALIGCAPEDVTDVVVTHAHMDHMGALELFENARFYLQREELEGWEGVAADPMMAGALMPHIVDGGDLVRARQLVDEGRMTLLEGDVTGLLPGIDVHALRNCHSNVDQMVLVHTADGPYLYAGDLATRETHLTGMGDTIPHYGWQTGSSGSAYLALHAYPKALALVGGDAHRIILPHDVTYRETRPLLAKDGFAECYRIC